MSLIGVLSRLSLAAPRWVTVNGVLVTDGVTVSNGVASHPQHGLVTPVKPHTFHGGTAPPRGAELRPWWEQQPDLLEAERTAMAAAFPGFTLTFSKKGRPSWTGEIDTGRGRFEVRVTHARDRGVIPLVKVLSPKRLGRPEGRRFRRPDHLYLSDHLCVAAEADWNPTTDDATTVLAWTAHWLAVYSEWRVRGGAWPVVGHVAA